MKHHCSLQTSPLGATPPSLISGNVNLLTGGGPPSFPQRILTNAEWIAWGVKEGEFATRRWVRFVVEWRRTEGEMREPEQWIRRREGRRGRAVSRGKLVSSMGSGSKSQRVPRGRRRAQNAPSSLAPNHEPPMRNSTRFGHFLSKCVRPRFESRDDRHSVSFLSELALPSKWRRSELVMLRERGRVSARAAANEGGCLDSLDLDEDHLG